MNTLIVTRSDGTALLAACEYLMALSASGQPYRVHYAVDGLICLAAPQTIAINAAQQEFVAMMGFTDAATMQATLLATASAITYCRSWAEAHNLRPDLLDFNGMIPRTASTPTVIAEATSSRPSATLLTV